MQEHPLQQPQYRPRVGNATAARLRAEVPIGPVHLPHLASLAEKYRIHPEYVFRIATGITHRRPQAFPPGHPAIPTLGYTPPPRQHTKTNLTLKSKQVLLQDQDGRCVYCFSPITWDKATIDHIVPKAKGGANDIDNLQLTCRECNQYKNIMSDQQWREQLNRRQKLDHVQTQPGPNKFRHNRLPGIKKCTCHIHGCRPDCPGCKLCAHTSKESPAKLICPAGEKPPSTCYTPQQCLTAKACTIGHAP